MHTKITLLLMVLGCGFFASAQTTITDGSLVGDTDYTWRTGEEYVLDGLVYLEAGSTLTIEPGVVIRGLDEDRVTGNDNTSALIIMRDAQIFAEGTADNPIIFTAFDDDLADPSDLSAIDRGEWGGLIILGNGIIGNGTTEDNIEGVASTETRARYGGTNNMDNSGVLRYVSIRHGGAQLSQDNEINGLTLGAVGSGTTIEYVEVFANLDDGIEWFGGAVDIKHASVAFCGDDAYDYDQGWVGRGQFWFALQAPNTSTGRSGEHDGATPDNAPPFSNPTIYNATYIGIGSGNTATGGDANREGRQQSVVFRDNAGGKYRNSLFTGFNQRAIAIEDLDDTDENDSYARLLAGDLVLENNLFEDFGAGNTAADLFNAITAGEEIINGESNNMVISMLGDANEIGTSGIANVGRAPGENLDPRIDAGGNALSGAAAIDEDVNGDGFFNLVTYRGAFGNTVNWLDGWTALSDYGYLGDEVTPLNNFDCTVIRDGDLVGGQTYNWGQGGECYTLDGLVFLEEDGILNIEPGTIIRGLDADRISTNDNTSALIITRGAQIFANGNAENPIIFTAADDDTEDPADLTSRDRGEWGGLIILGEATIANSEAEDNIEGIASTEPRARYGGSNDADNSGELSYVSIRHGGAQLSQDNEINGLTLGGVGSGTTIEFVEVFANLDDGIEWFGGTVDVKFASVAFCGDDGMDYDQGWRGKGQFWFVLQEPNTSTGRSGEHDGATPDNAAPFSNPLIYNATYIGIGNGNTASGGDANREGRQQSVVFRDNAGGQYRNSLFTDFNQRAIAIEDRDDTDTDDSYARLIAGDLVIADNLFENFGAGNTPGDIFNAITAGEEIINGESNNMVVSMLGDVNEIGASGIANIGREPGGNLDPRIDAGGAALSGGVPNSDDPFFQLVSYRGAFGNANNWLEGWTALSDMNYLGDEVEELDNFDCTVIRDGDLVGGQTYNWGQGGECYTLDGLVFLEEDGVLNIEPGTIIRGLDADRVSTNDNTSALIITRGAQIFANGNAENPIIFTAADDDTEDPEDLTSRDRGEWGGLIILGEATIANSETEDNIEGIASTEPRARYGGSNDEDNSGELRYVSIRHGGAQLSQDNEINGLTLGGVGSGTTIEFVEVFANLDDGIEWFGGTVDVKFASVAFCGDDGMDYDQGWRGKGQFWFVLQEPNTSTGRSGEHDGATPDNAAPFSNPLIYNATYIGIGEGNTASGGDANREGRQQSVVFRDNAGGQYRNSLFTDFNQRAIAIEDRDDTDTDDSYARLIAGDLVISNNLFENFGAGDNPADIFNAITAGEEIIDGMSNNMVISMLGDANEIGASGIANIGREPGGNLDPRIDAGGAALSGGIPNSEDEFFQLVSYRGAFGNANNWLEGWTALSDMNYLGDEVEELDNFDCTVIRDGDLVGGQTYNWGQGGECYTLDGLVFLEADGVLNIEPGTIIRGLDADRVSTNDNTSALIITRDAQIFARGTAAEPIIFTAADDDTEDPTDLTSIDRGEWGGLIILGNAPIANSEDEDNVEGIASTEPRARYGGSMADDNSGVLRYVSIRHGGAQLSQDNEINGLTLGGVGSGTEIDFVEVFANLDDGIEWFGGTVTVDHAAVAFCGDDSYDYDQGWLGGGQYWFSLQGPGTSTGRAGEHDGATPDNAPPFSNPTIVNATYVGIGADGMATGGDANRDDRAYAVVFRDNAGGTYANSIFADFNRRAIAIEDRDDTDTDDSAARLAAGDLSFINNIFWNFGSGSTVEELFFAINAAEERQEALSGPLRTAITNGGNEIFDPVFIDESRDMDGFSFDPRPNEFAGAATGAMTMAGFDDVPYRGAFEPGRNSGNDALSWLSNWTALSSTEIVMDTTTSVGRVEQLGFLLDAPVPNPAAYLTNVNFSLPRVAEVRMTVVDVIGRPVRVLRQTFPAGPQTQVLDVTDLPNGTYFIIMDADQSRLIQKMVVNK